MRILIVRLSHLGDVVCSVGMLHALHDAYPSAEIGWVVQREYAELLAPLPGLSQVFPFDRRGGLGGLLRLRRVLRGFRPELCVDAQGNLKSALVDWLTGAPRRVGFARSEWQEALGSVAVPERALPSGAAHLVARVRHLASHVAPEGLFETGLALTPEELRAGDERLDTSLHSASAPILLHLSSPGDTRGWPLEHWEELARRLLRAGRPVLCLSGPAEEREGRELASRLEGAVARGTLAHWIGQKGLRQLAGLFGAAARRGGRLIACDSGPMHLAWAAGLAVSVLEGPQSAERTGPWPPRGGAHEELRAPTSPPCAPCIARRCTHPEGPVCLRDLRPEHVLASLRARVER